LTFARREKAQKKPLGLNGVVLKTIERKAYDLKVSRVGVRADLDPKLPLIMGDFHQMQVVFGNLVNNAQQAMFETNGRGTLTITSRPQGERVVVTLSDDGPGVPAENLRRVFDPFFTTREVGKGVGLGLSVCYAIVRDHGGTIRAMPNPEGQGATIVLEIPAAKPEELEESGRAAEESRSSGQRLSGPRILVADSEGHVQDLLVELLSGMGYRVDTADSGDAALTKIRSAEYDGLIADLRAGPAERPVSARDAEGGETRADAARHLPRQRRGEPDPGGVRLGGRRHADRQAVRPRHPAGGPAAPVSLPAGRLRHRALILLPLPLL